MSWGAAARLRAQECREVQQLPPPKPRTSVRARRLLQGCSYLMACFSIVFPAAFFVLGILLTSMNGKTVSPSRSTIASVADIAAAIWPVIFAAVVAQGFKTWFLLKADRWNSKGGQIVQSAKLPHFLEAMCLLVFLVWCLSPFGSEALARAHGLATTTQQTSTDVWYVDHTGYNPIWSANSTLIMSAENRSELVQIISEKYISSLAPSTMLSDDTTSTTTYALPAPLLPGSTDYASGRKDDSVSSLSLLSVRHLNGIPGLNPIAGSSIETLSFSMTTSRFVFTCGNWSLTRRNIGNTTSATNMSYSESQTLGLSMSSGNDSTGAMSTITFASLNKISDANGTTLVRSSSNSTSPQNETWEYSSIQCGFKQYFYSEPVHCEQAAGIHMGACVQSDEQALILSPTETAQTQLDDFAQEFVSANLLTGERDVTASKLSGFFV